MRTIPAGVFLFTLGTLGCDAREPESEVADHADAARDAEAVLDRGGRDDARPLRELPDFAPPTPPDAGPDAGDGPPPSPETADPSAPLAGQNEWGPMARVDDLDLPEDAPTARRSGCQVEGPSAGSGVRNLVAVAGGDLRRVVTPDSEGRVPSVLLFRAVGWDPGTSALDLRQVDLEFYEGTQGEDLAFLVKRAAFSEGDPTAGSRVVYPDEPVERGWLATQPGHLELPLNLVIAPELALPISNARVAGRLSADGPGFRLDKATLTGYLTLEDGRRLVERIKTMCAVPEPPGLCALVGGQLDRPTDELVDLVVGILGGFEVRYTDGSVSPCDPEAEQDCNAVGVCLLLAARGVEVVGVEAP